METTRHSVPIRFSSRQHARIWFVLAVVFFLLAGGSFYWREMAQYRTYLGIGLVLFVLGLVPLLLGVFQGRRKV